MIEKAILKTLIYSDLFDFPLKAWEIHRWLIGEKVELGFLEKSLKGLLAQKKIAHYRGLYFLHSRQVLVSRRNRKQRYSEKVQPKAKFAGRLLVLIPWIKLVGITGGLAINNIQKHEAVDLLIVTSRNRGYLTRLLALGLLELFNLAKDVCLTSIISEENLAQPDQNIYLAHEILQLQPLWQRKEMYHRFLYANSWVFEYLPNWISSFETSACNLSKRKKKRLSQLDSFGDFWEAQAGKIQPKARVSFCRDLQSQILADYYKRLSRYRLLEKT